MKRISLFKLCVILRATSSWVTAMSAQMPIPEVREVNSDTAKKYKRFKIRLDFPHVEIENTQDHQDIDLYGFFCELL